MEGAASWHPSIIGHRLRAAHHAYFWLLILAQAIDDLLSNIAHNRAIDGMMKDLHHHIEHNSKDISTYRTMNPSVLPDNMKCLTDYEPRSIRDVSLKSNVLAGLVADTKDETSPGNKNKFVKQLEKPRLFVSLEDIYIYLTFTYTFVF